MPAAPWRRGGRTRPPPRRCASCAPASCRRSTISRPPPPICARPCARRRIRRRRSWCWPASARSPAIMPRPRNLRPPLRAASRLGRAACAASIGSLTGAAEASERALAEALAEQPRAAPSLRLWALTILGEIAIRRDDPAAEQYLKDALALDGRDVYALTVYADYLLDKGRAAEALSLLRGFERVDALYLRLALAAQMADDPGFPAYRDGVAARYAAARRQGDRLHLRDASRFALEIEHDGPRALDFARQNWEVHKTPYDARALLAAAIACGELVAVQPLIDWVRATRLNDRTLERLIERL